jgi:hypothetical protein
VILTLIRMRMLFDLLKVKLNDINGEESANTLNIQMTETKFNCKTTLPVFQSNIIHSYSLVKY